MFSQALEEAEEVCESAAKSTDVVVPLNTTENEVTGGEVPSSNDHQGGPHKFSSKKFFLKVSQFMYLLCRKGL